MELFILNKVRNTTSTAFVKQLYISCVVVLPIMLTHYKTAQPEWKTFTFGASIKQLSTCQSYQLITC